MDKIIETILYLYLLQAVPSLVDLHCCCLPSQPPHKEVCCHFRRHCSLRVASFGHYLLALLQHCQNFSYAAMQTSSANSRSVPGCYKPLIIRNERFEWWNSNEIVCTAKVRSIVDFANPSRAKNVFKLSILLLAQLTLYSVPHEVFLSKCSRLLNIFCCSFMFWCDRSIAIEDEGTCKTERLTLWPVPIL